MRQRTNAGNPGISVFALSLLLLPLLVAPQQQEQRHYRKSPHEQGPLVDSYTPLEVNRDDRRHEATVYNHLKDTTIDTHEASAVATLAPVEDAVRASIPARWSGRSVGLSSPRDTRSLQDWEVEDFVLLATVDGSIHARDRRTGAPRWALGVDKPMVETIYYNRTLGAEFRPEDAMLWIIEPSQDGEIYIYNQEESGGLQRLSMTVKQLVNISPWSGEDPAVVYTAEKKTTLYTVDARTGNIIKSFSAQGSSMTNENSCRKLSGIEGFDEEKCVSVGSLVLGRTEYTIGVQWGETAKPICTLKYSEWVPNNRDRDLSEQYSTTMDMKYVYPGHDGRVFGFDHARIDERPSFTQKLPSPVVRVFDIARPVEIGNEDPQLIVLPQPVGPVPDELRYQTLKQQDRIFVNHTTAGGWYAMSESMYPLVAGGAKKAQCYEKHSMEMPSPMDASQLANNDALVGVHALSNTQGKDENLLTISATEVNVLNDVPKTVPSESRPLHSRHAMANSRMIGNAAANATDFQIFLWTIFVVLSTIAWMNRRAVVKNLKRYVDTKTSVINLDQQIHSIPSTPIVAHAPWSGEPKSEPEPVTIESLENIETSEIIVEVATPTTSNRSTLLEPPSITRSRAGSVDSERGRSSNEQRVRIQEPSPSPSRIEDDDILNSPQTGKKKARRGCRGGAKHKKKRSNSKHESKDATVGEQVPDPTVERTVKEVMQIARTPPIEPDVIVVPSTSESDMTDVSGSVVQIGHLRVYTDSIIGYGSHGTMVYKGSFGGRDVAVKRMLLEFYEIASHEVGLLQKSDDHPNIIRYYDKESHGEFLYIALELCDASLQEVIEKPLEYPSLIGDSGIDPPDVLRQITAGLHYLHSLKIVHRDIKPQNILVSPPKALATTTTPRILISDFGLCKKLEGDQNSFRATTAHAAGTSGWRAPELLVDDDLATPNSTNLTNGDTSEPAVVDPQTNRRATRAIDIFSLGCVFYYILTGGNHPFDKDGKYMREANIVKGAYNIDDLSTLGDYQWEAKDLISRMLAKNPHERPDASAVLLHPFFWSAEDRLDFLCHVSDGFEVEPREPPSFPLLHLESYADDILHDAKGDFLRALPREFLDTLGKQRKYNGGRVLDLLRALRNKKHHYEDMPLEIQRKVGVLPGGYLGFWTRRFPSLLMCCQRVVVELHWHTRDRYKRFF